MSHRTNIFILDCFPDCQQDDEQTWTATQTRLWLWCRGALALGGLMLALQPAGPPTTSCQLSLIMSCGLGTVLCLEYGNDDSERPDVPGDCGVALCGVGHAAVHAACGGGHGGGAGVCSGGDTAASFPSSYHFGLVQWSRVRCTKPPYATWPSAVE